MIRRRGWAVDDLSMFCCLNSHCPDHRIRGGGNLSVCGHYGAGDSIRFLRCRSCGGRFSERKGTPLFRSHLPKEKAVALLEHVAEGCGVRQTERLVGVHRDTVTRYVRKAGDHAVAAHDELVALSPPDHRGPVR
jgi:transposase-like protein